MCQNNDKKNISAVNTVSNFYDHTKHSATDTFKTASKLAIQKTAEATSDKIEKENAARITRSSKISSQSNLDTNEKVILTERFN